MSYQSNDIIFEKIDYILNNANDNIVNELRTMLLTQNIRNHSVDIQDNIITIQWCDRRNKANVYVVPLNEGVGNER